MIYLNSTSVQPSRESPSSHHLQLKTELLDSVVLLTQSVYLDLVRFVWVYLGFTSPFGQFLVLVEILSRNSYPQYFSHCLFAAEKMTIPFCLSKRFRKLSFSLMTGCPAMYLCVVQKWFPKLFHSGIIRKEDPEFPGLYRSCKNARNRKQKQ